MEPRPALSFDDTAIAFSYKSDKELRKANFVFSVVNHPWVSAISTGAVKFAFKIGLPIEGIVKATAFEHFCGGESIETASAAIEKLGKFNVGTILDYSVEGEKSEKGFDATAEETIRTIEKAGKTKHIPFTVFKTTGLGSMELLEKIQNKTALSADEQSAFERVRQRVDKICAKAHQLKIPVLVDAEETWIQEPIDDLAYAMMAKYNKERAIVYNTYQLYRTASLKNLEEAHTIAVNNKYYLGAKLVRGAYMEKERKRAAEKNYPDPIQPSKEASDEAFNQALEFSIDHKEHISIMCGSHNDYSNLYLTQLMDKHGMQPNDARVYFAQLYGMSDTISFNLAKAGYNVAKYVPYGPVKSVMPYLLRRAQENTSVAGQSSRELTLIRKELKRRKLEDKDTNV
jgi:proline dehydrogenase